MCMWWVVEPVTALFRSATGSATLLGHLWWMPTGPLSFLPIHAAGRYGPQEDDSRNALSLWTSSYTPTLRSLAQSPVDAVVGRPAPLVVAVPDAEGARPLPGAVREAERVGLRLDALHQARGPDRGEGRGQAGRGQAGQADGGPNVRAGHLFLPRAGQRLLPERMGLRLDPLRQAAGPTRSLRCQALLAPACRTPPQGSIHDLYR